MTSPLYRFIQNYVSPLVRGYSRLVVKGTENLPLANQGALLACNHSGSVWWDALCLIAASPEREVNFIAHYWDARKALLRAPLEQAGCEFLDADLSSIHANNAIVQSLKNGKLLCIYPEESYHSFRSRYTLFRFSPHVMQYAQLSGVPIVPVSIIGAEEAAATLVGLKMAGVPLHIPLLPPIILPFQVTVEFGEPVYFEDLVLGDAHESSEQLQLGADRLRQLHFNTISQYRRCKLSDLRYLEEKAWW